TRIDSGCLSSLRHLRLRTSRLTVNTVHDTVDMYLGGECRSPEPHLFPESPGHGPAGCVEENDMTVMASWELFEDVRNAQDELLRMNTMPAQRINLLGRIHPGMSTPTWTP